MPEELEGGFQQGREKKEIPPEYRKDVLAAVAVYTAVFERPPFNDKWSVELSEGDVEKVDGLMCSPFASNELFKKLIDSGIVKGSTDEGGETYQIPPGILIEHIDMILTDPFVEEIITSEESLSE